MVNTDRPACGDCLIDLVFNVNIVATTCEAQLPICASPASIGLDLYGFMFSDRPCVFS